MLHSATILSSQDTAQWYGTGHIIGRAGIQKHLHITICLLGLQIVWSTEFAQAAPYLLTLGLSKSATSLVFLAGPLAGLLVQPLAGSYSDNCKSSLGRRRPFIIAGACLCVVSLILFGYARDIAAWFTARDSSLHRGLTLWFAIVSIYVLDFSINAVQAMDRAILVDVVPAPQQEEATAWAGRMLGAGSVLGYLISGSNLTRIFGWISTSQIKIITLLALITFILTHALTCYAVTERVLLSNHPSHSSSLKSTLLSIYTTFRTLPLPIWRVMQVQLFAWTALFALMFYSSTWVAEIYIKQHSNLASGDLSQVSSAVSEAATRAGSRALLFQSLVVLFTSVCVPFLVTPNAAAATRSPPARRFRFVDIEAAEDDIFTRVLARLDSYYEIIWRRMPKLPIPWLSLQLAWGLSQVSFSVLMFSTWFASGVVSASLIIALSGITMGLAMWAPFALLGEYILQTPSASQAMRSMTHLPPDGALPLSPIPEEDEEEYSRRSSAYTSPTASRLHINGHQSPALSEKSPDKSYQSSYPPTMRPNKDLPRVLQIRHSDSFDQDDRPSFAEEADVALSLDVQNLILSEGTADSAGTILGIHNICIVLPQLFTTFLSSVLFAWLAPGRTDSIEAGVAATPPGTSDAIGTVLRLGGVATCFACWICWKMDQEEKQRLANFAPA